MHRNSRARQIVDARLWFAQLVAEDYDGELPQMNRELEAELSR
jgi:hypothetical protein